MDMLIKFLLYDFLVNEVLVLNNLFEEVKFLLDNIVKVNFD